MVFSSVIFLFLFLPLCLFGYYILPKRARNFFLLFASLFFYAWGEPRFVFVMIASVLVNYGFGLLVDRAGECKRRARGIVALMVCFNLSVFFIYKYLNFTIGSINAAFGSALPQTAIALPIGISFFTFQAMSYVFDVYRKRGAVQKNPFAVMLYVSLFPQLIAGPIVRYETIAAELDERTFVLEDFAQGIKRFSVGLAKKVIIANAVAVIADQAFSLSGSALGLATAWIGIISYTLQIYFDFSGYSDMAIGLGLMFGFHFDENFNYPYVAASISDFWRRWHISLGTWFRDYVYIPLGGSRVRTKFRLVLNMLVVWALTGIWHGASWNFLLWGLFYFVLLTFEKLTGIPGRVQNRVFDFVYYCFTMLCVVLGWVLFRAVGIAQAMDYFKSMLWLNGNSFVDSVAKGMLKNNGVLLVLAIVLCTPLMQNLTRWLSGKFSSNKLYPWLENASYCILLILGVSFTVASSYNPFIYFNF